MLTNTSLRLAHLNKTLPACSSALKLLVIFILFVFLTPSPVFANDENTSYSIKKHHSEQQETRKVLLLHSLPENGRTEYLTVKKIQSIMVQNPEVQFVLQPFLAFDSGFTFQENQTATDIRLIFHHDQMLQCYLRMAQKDDFRCNEHQGGELVYVTKKDIPTPIRSIAKKIVTIIDNPNSLYALDFIVSNGGQVYFLEGNFGPGLDWDVKKSE